MPTLVTSVLVMLTNSDWSGEQENVQNKLKKLALQAGHDAMSGSALLRFSERLDI
jgi:hypothetical protein